MARKVKSLDDRNLLLLDGFARQVESALEQIADPTGLGERSSLAAPYLLDPLLEANATSAPARGRVLRALLLEAIATLGDDTLQRVAVAAFVERNPHLTNAGVALRLGMNERSFYRARSLVVRSVADTLYKQLCAPLQLESPARPSMVGRLHEAEQITSALRAGRSVYLTAASGYGKSTLAAHIADAWGQAAFWYTIRLDYNDRLENVLFALAYFLRRHGAHRTWRQLVANSGVLSSEQVLGLLRYDLDGILPGALLLCIDDVDLLQSERADHAQLLHLLDELRPRVALLLVGQRVALETDELVQLAPLSDDELDEWRSRLGADAHLTPDQVRTLTRGIPVLLAALLLLGRSDPEAPALLLAAGELISVESLFHRVWRKLSPDERTLLELLALFEEAAPADIWQQDAGHAGGRGQPLLAGLIERGLVMKLATGLVQVMPYLRLHTIAHIPADRRELHHRRAALLLEERGQCTPAMQHWLAGNLPAHAIWLWLRHRRHEINRGQASHALALLASIPTSQLAHANDRTALRVALAELYLHVGRAEEADALLRTDSDTVAPLVASYFDELRADTLRWMSENERSLTHYRASLEALLDSAPRREVRVRGKLVHHFVFHQPDPDAALREAIEGRIQAESFHGVVEEMRGNLAEARTRFETALALAESMSVDPALLAHTCTHLAQLLIVQGSTDEAALLIERSNTLREQRGETLQPLHDRINLAYAYSQEGDYTRAYALAHEGLAHARRMRHAYLICGLAAAAGEAALGLGRLDEAEMLLMEAVAQEEEWFLHWALAGLASLRSAQQRHAQALALGQQALDSATSTHNPYAEAYCLRILGDVQRAAGQQEAARATYAHAHTLFIDMGLPREAAALSERLAF